MGLESFRVWSTIPSPPEVVFRAWLDSEEHTNFTGGKATIDPRVGGRHTARDGYIEGEILELHPGRRIAKTWRTSEFPADAVDSQLEIAFAEHPDGTLLTLVHTEIPEGQGARYQEGWREHYFVPMRQYFAAKSKRTGAIGNTAKGKGAPKAARASKSRKVAARKSPTKRPKAKKLSASKGGPEKRRATKVSPARGAPKKASPGRASRQKATKVRAPRAKGKGRGS